MVQGFFQGLLTALTIKCILYDMYLLLLVVKDHIALIDKEMHVWRPNCILRDLTNFFIKRNHIVTHKTNGSTTKR
ncbi:Uncharacterised protein [Streptococcus pneumoniae]|nr:Uncharacterised protein [Streptococcus pneumoniae]